MLKALGYSLKSNKKCLSSGNSPDRDAQFQIINNLRKDFIDRGDPIIGVDTKKKELIGVFKNPGRIWSRTATQVKDHDFRSEAIGIANPYGIYDVGLNTGLLVVGRSADTPEFAVNSIVTWWKRHGQQQYPHAKRLLILADSGGSNGARPRAWKKFLQELLANPFCLQITVAHYPTGASKWNPIEHRLFSEISKNWAGIPLTDFESVVNLAKNTQTATGLRVDSVLDDRDYEKGIRVSDQQMKELLIVPNKKIGKWNYSILPTSSAVRLSSPVRHPKTKDLHSQQAA